MNAFSEKETARQLRRFDAVWQRVQEARRSSAPEAEPEIRLMPRKQRDRGCCGRNRGRR